MHDQHRLPRRRRRPSPGSNARKLWNHGVSACRRTSGGISPQPFAGQHRRLDLLLQRHLRGRARHPAQLHRIQLQLLLLEHQLGAGRRRAGQRDDGRHAFSREAA